MCLLKSWLGQKMKKKKGCVENIKVENITQ